MDTWRADRTLTLFRATNSGLTVGFAGELVGWLTGVRAAGPSFGVGLGVALGLVFGLTNGLALGGHRAWLAYLVATYRLAWARLLPRRLMPFLDDAHRLGLLRAVGPIYQFRHAELHDHLAATYAPPR
jgi:hypothetical protein